MPDAAVEPGDDPDVPGEPPPAAPGCHGTTPLTRVCLASEPTAPLDLSGTIDTATAACLPTKMSTAAGACVLAGTSVTIGPVTATGPKPLVILATTGAIEINGDLDAASHVGGTTGAGAGTGTCNAGTAPANRGGGQGGSLGGKGGNGGNASLAQGGGGRAGDPVPLGDTLRGGCTGAKGQGANGGAGGAGGGAIALISKTRILVAANVNASGAGGTRGKAGGLGGGGGGGGGGSGGVIVLDTPDLELSGRLFANGGGGGGAGDATRDGISGKDPIPPQAGTGGEGGAEGGSGGGGSLGGNGGNGGNGASFIGANGGGGGGGGGAGVILATDPPPSAGVSPPVK